MKMNQSNTVSGFRAGRFMRLPGFAAMFLLIVLFGSVVFNANAHAQTSYGSVVGTVTDPSGAIIPGTAVVLKNTVTNTSETVVTGAAGNFTFANLNPSNYDLTATKQGFESLTQSGINVQVGAVVRVDVALKLGTQTETVVVSAAQSLMQTESAELGGVVQGQQVE